MTTVTLRHFWNAPSELRALAVIEHALARVNLRWTDEPASDGIELVKMHGREITAARRGGLVDVAPFLDVGVLRDRVLPCVLDPMLTPEGACHGVPMGMHRSNCLWINSGRTAELGELRLERFHEWFEWLARAHRARPFPLAVSMAPWQLCLLFECVLLGGFRQDVLDRDLATRGVFAFSSRAVQEALKHFAALRRYVSTRSLSQSWRGLADDLRSGEVAALVMGDWVRKEFTAWGGPPGDSVVEHRVPGTQGMHLFNVDYFVPVNGTGKPLPAQGLARLVSCLTDSAVQQAFCDAKGSVPAVIDRTGLADATDTMVPSLTFDHVADVEHRAAIADAVSAFFLGSSTLASALRLFDECRASSGR